MTLLHSCASGTKTGIPTGIQKFDFIGAGDGIRTHDPNLGKVLTVCAAIDFARIFPAKNAHFRALFRGFLVHCTR
jgi:hypothetical protein